MKAVGLVVGMRGPDRRWTVGEIRIRAQADVQAMFRCVVKAGVPGFGNGQVVLTRAVGSAIAGCRFEAVGPRLIQTRTQLAPACRGLQARAEPGLRIGAAGSLP